MTPVFFRSFRNSGSMPGKNYGQVRIQCVQQGRICQVLLTFQISLRVPISVLNRRQCCDSFLTVSVKVRMVRIRDAVRSKFRILQKCQQNL